MNKIRLFSVLLLIISVSQNVNSEELAYLAEYEEEYRNIIENYLGYYLISDRPNDVMILKLSLRGHLIIHEININNNELLEVNRIVLDRALKNKNNEMMFLNNKSEYDFGNPIRYFQPPYVYYNPNNRSYPFPENFAIGYKSEIKNKSYRLVLDNAVFTPNSHDVINLINLYFSSEAQRRYAGKFNFSKYEIIGIRNMEVPFTDDEIQNDVIVIDMNNNDWLLGKHISTYHKNRLHDFFKRYGQDLISGLNADGEGFFYNYSYRFIDLDTIIFEWEGSGVINNDKNGYIHYKIYFNRENISSGDF